MHQLLIAAILYSLAVALGQTCYGVPCPSQAFVQVDSNVLFEKDLSVSEFRNAQYDGRTDAG